MRIMSGGDEPVCFRLDRVVALHDDPGPHPGPAAAAGNRPRVPVKLNPPGLGIPLFQEGEDVKYYADALGDLS